MTAMVGKRCDFYLASGSAIAFTQEAMTDVSANRPGVPVRTIYTITNAVKRYWDPTVALTTEESLDSAGSWHAVVPDSIEYAGGRFVFNSSRQAAPAALYRVSGSYIPWARVGGGHEWGAEPVIAINDATEFMQNSKTHTSTLLNEGRVSLARWWLDDTLRTLLVAGAQVAVILWLNAAAQPTGPRWEAYARLASDAIKVAVGDNHEEDLQFELQSQLTYISG